MSNKAPDVLAQVLVAAVTRDVATGGEVSDSLVKAALEQFMMKAGEEIAKGAVVKGVLSLVVFQQPSGEVRLGQAIAANSGILMHMRTLLQNTANATLNEAGVCHCPKCAIQDGVILMAFSDVEQTGQEDLTQIIKRDTHGLH